MPNTLGRLTSEDFHYPEVSLERYIRGELNLTPSEANFLKHRADEKARKKIQSHFGQYVGEHIADTLPVFKNYGMNYVRSVIAADAENKNPEPANPSDNSWETLFD